MKASRFPVVLLLSCLSGCASGERSVLALAAERLRAFSPLGYAPAQPAQQDRIVVEQTRDAGPKWKTTTKALKPQPVAASVREPTLPPWTIAAPKPANTLPYTLRPSELFKKLSPSVYTIAMSSQGSAVAVSSKELVTNCHVVSHGRTVTLYNAAATLKADVVSADPATDRCFLRIQDGELQPVQGLRDYSTLVVGEPVYTIGSPKGLDNTLGAGLLSGLRNGEKNAEYIQITAPLSAGSSGGGLFDERGNLIGVTSFTVRDSQNLNFAIAASQFWK